PSLSLPTPTAPASTLFPYTTLFRSRLPREAGPAAPDPLGDHATARGRSHPPAAPGPRFRQPVPRAGRTPRRHPGVARVDRARRGAGALGGPPGRCQRAGTLRSPPQPAALVAQGFRRIRRPPVSTLARQSRGRPAAALRGRGRRIPRPRAAIHGASAVR